MITFDFLVAEGSSITKMLGSKAWKKMAHEMYMHFNESIFEHWPDERIVQACRQGDVSIPSAAFANFLLRYGLTDRMVYSTPNDIWIEQAIYLRKYDVVCAANITVHSHEAYFITPRLLSQYWDQYLIGVTCSEENFNIKITFTVGTAVIMVVHTNLEFALEHIDTWQNRTGKCATGRSNFLLPRDISQNLKHADHQEFIAFCQDHLSYESSKFTLALIECKRRNFIPPIATLQISGFLSLSSFICREKNIRECFPNFRYNVVTENSQPINDYSTITWDQLVYLWNHPSRDLLLDKRLCEQFLDAYIMLLRRRYCRSKRTAIRRLAELRIAPSQRYIVDALIALRSQNVI